MGKQNFGERFAESHGAPIRFEGRDIVPMHRMTVCSTEITVRFARAHARVRQALRMKLDGGTLTVNGQDLSDVVLWADTAPQRVTVHARPREGEGELKLWNAWEDERGTMQAWIGNGGVRVDPVALDSASELLSVEFGVVLSTPQPRAPSAVTHAGNGLQIREPRFNSARRLQPS